MKENICTIPINDLFKPKCGCPLCSMEAMLEKQYVEFVTGDAMMEPSVRVETNKKGFCRRHYLQMAQTGQKLPNALILETHLQETIDSYVSPKLRGKPDKKKLEGLKSMLKTCYVCDRIDRDMHHLMATVFAEWTKNEEFRKLYLEQPYLCLKHYVLITEAAMGKGGVPSKLLPAFHDDTLKLTRGYLESLKEDVSYFVTMFDYRSKGKDWGTSVDSIERSIDFLTGSDNPAPEV